MEFFPKYPHIVVEGIEYSFSGRQVLVAELLWRYINTYVEYVRVRAYCMCSDRTIRDCVEKLQPFFKEQGYELRTNNRNTASASLGLFKVKK